MVKHLIRVVFVLFVVYQKNKGDYMGRELKEYMFKGSAKKKKKRAASQWEGYSEEEKRQYDMQFNDPEEKVKK